MSRTLTRTLATLTVTLGVLAPLTACSNTTQEAVISVENCDNTITFDTDPQRVTLLHSAAVPTLNALGVLDRAVSKAGVYPDAYFDAELQKSVAEIPTMTDRMDASGHLQISREAVVVTNPDLVLGSTDTVNTASLASSDIPLVEEPAFCGSLDGDAGFEHVWEQIRTYGTIFDRNTEAEAFVTQLQGRVEQMAGHTESEDRTVAVLYPTVGGGVTYAYGQGSMSNPLVEAAGLENVFADQDERVFEVTAEEIINRNPDVIIALYTDGYPAEVTDALHDLPGASTLTAIQDDAVMPLLLNFAEPPTPLAVDGLDQLVTFLGEN